MNLLTTSAACPLARNTRRPYSAQFSASVQQFTTWFTIRISSLTKFFLIGSPRERKFERITSNAPSHVLASQKPYPKKPPCMAGITAF